MVIGCRTRLSDQQALPPGSRACRETDFRLHHAFKNAVFAIDVYAKFFCLAEKDGSLGIQRAKLFLDGLNRFVGRTRASSVEREEDDRDMPLSQQVLDLWRHSLNAKWNQVWRQKLAGLASAIKWRVGYAVTVLGELFLGPIQERASGIEWRACIETLLFEFLHSGCNTIGNGGIETEYE